MRVIDVIQGTPEWLAHRAAHFNASDAPAMMGCSPNKSRTELVKELALGVPPEFSDFVQRRILDKGHEFEKQARPLAEEFAGQEFSPLSGECDADPRFAASFDGIDFTETMAWEHKRLNASLRAAMHPDCIGAELPMVYQVQMEHQCMVSGVEKVLFTASDWNDDGQLLDIRHCWYTPNMILRTQIIAGWDQLAQDVEAYRANPPQAAAPVVAQHMDSLPAVAVQVNGALAVSSNLPAFGDALREFIDRLPEHPAGDQDFADCEAACKVLKKAEDALEAAESGALAQISDVEAMRRAVADLRSIARTTRLRFEKLVAAEKDARKAQIIKQAQDALDAHIDALNVRLGSNWLQRKSGGFGECTKGLKSADSMQDRVSVALANAKVQANALADQLDANRKHLLQGGQDWFNLFADFATVGTKAAEDFQALAALRIQAEQARIERVQLVALEQKVQQSIADAAKAGLYSESKAAEMSELVEGMVIKDIAGADADKAISEAKASAAAVGSDTLTLGQLNALLAPIHVDAAGLASLGFAPSHTVKSAKHYAAADVPRICQALVSHLQTLVVHA